MKLFSKLQRQREAGAQQGANPIAPDALQPGQPAPDFSLTATTDQPLGPRDFRGRPLILAFYPADKTPVCSNQLALYNQALPLFAEYGAQLLAISVDGPESHRQFAAELKLNFPLLSDHAPQGSVAKQYGVYNSEYKKTQRALFVIDPQGIVHWSEVVPPDVNPGAHGILAALKEITA